MKFSSDESKRIIEIKRGGHTDTLISCACSAVGLELEEVLRHISSEISVFYF